MELQGRVDQLRARGLGLAAISYDPREILAGFAERRGITFPLLSDPGSETIKKFGLLNEEAQAGSRQYGIPHPGTFVLDARGIVTARFFEERYQERDTLGSILVKTGPSSPGASGAAPISISTSHLDVTTWATADIAAPGHRFSIVFDVAPRERIHVYAPGNADYIPISLAIEPQQFVKIHELSYPPSELYEFKPLKEVVQVYQKPFRLTQDVMIEATPDAQKALADRPSLTIKAMLAYQACDDTVCFPPMKVPMNWTVKLKTLDRRQ